MQSGVISFRDGAMFDIRVAALGDSCKNEAKASDRIANYADYVKRLSKVAGVVAALGDFNTRQSTV